VFRLEKTGRKSAMTAKINKFGIACNRVFWVFCVLFWFPAVVKAFLLGDAFWMCVVPVVGCSLILSCPFKKRSVKCGVSLRHF